MSGRAGGLGGFVLALWCLAQCSCSIGPKVLENTRLRYNEAIKTTSEEQLLLNIVRLRYTDSPSSLAVSNIAAQNEFSQSLQAMPFFTSSGDVARSFATILPQAGISNADRPTLSYTPLDDQEFTRKLFTPLPLEGIAYLSRTTWPISTVFRLWLENLNWVSNAETASGPTPKQAPVYAEFVQGMQILQRLQDRRLVSFFVEEREEKLAEGIPANGVTGHDVLDAAKENIEYRKDATGTWTAVKKKSQPLLRVAVSGLNDPDMLEFCRIFHLKPGETSYTLVSDKLDPFFKDVPAEGTTMLDLESRSLLQVLFFVAHGVEVPPEHVTCGLVPMTLEPDGRVFDWHQVLEGLFRVCCSSSKKRPPHAYVAVHFAGYWYYIDERDRDTKATFALLLELSRLELTGKTGATPVLTLPLGGR